MQKYNENFMIIVLKEALVSYKHNDVPVGCLIAKNDEIISTAHNTQNSLNIATNHAELSAINKACKKLCTNNLSDCVMYVTLEPCIMCLGAIINAKIKTIYIGATSSDNGAIISRYPLVKDELIYPYKMDYYFKKTISPYILKRFFRNIRKGEK